jgi:hypothetical protein
MELAGAHEGLCVEGIVERAILAQGTASEGLDQVQASRCTAVVRFQTDPKCEKIGVNQPNLKVSHA